MELINSSGCTAFYTILDGKDISKLNEAEKKKLIELLSKRINSDNIKDILYSTVDLNDINENYIKWYELGYDNAIEQIPSYFFNCNKKISECTFDELFNFYYSIFENVKSENIENLIHILIDCIECDEYYSDDEPCDSCGDYVTQKIYFL